MKLEQLIDRLKVLSDYFYDNDYVATNARIPQNLFIPSLTRNFFLSKEEAEGVAEYLVNFKKEVVR